MSSIVNDQIVHASVKKKSERMNVGVLSIVSKSIENEHYKINKYQKFYNIFISCANMLSIVNENTSVA